MKLVIFMIKLQDLIVHALLLLLSWRFSLPSEYFFDDLLEEFLSFL